MFELIKYCRSKHVRGGVSGIFVFTASAHCYNQHQNHKHQVSAVIQHFHAAAAQLLCMTPSFVSLH